MIKQIYSLLWKCLLLCIVSSTWLRGDPPRPELYGDDPQSVFIRAARDGDLPLMEALMKYEDIDIDRPGLEKANSWFTSGPPLWEAARMGRTDAVMWLLEKGASVGIQDSFRRLTQPLTSAILHNDLRMLRALLDAGERPFPAEQAHEVLIPRPRDFPILAAVTYDRVECLKIMREYGISITGRLNPPHVRPISLFLHAVNAGSARAVSYLLEAGEDPNQTDLGFPAITIAAGSYSVETLHHLLAAGADVNAVTIRNGDPFYAVYTPLIRAVENGDLDMVNALLAAGADVSPGNHSALYHASLRGNPDVYHRLVSAGSKWVPDRFEGRIRKQLYSSAETDEVEGLGRLADDFQSQVLGKNGTKPEVAGTVRVAVLPGKDVSDAAALLQVRLSENPEFEILEREELDRILGEFLLESADLVASDYPRVLAFTPAEYVVVLTEKRSPAAKTPDFVLAELVSIQSGEVTGSWLMKVSGKEMAENMVDLATDVSRHIAQIRSEDGQANVVLEAIRYNGVGPEARKLENELNLILRNWLVCDISVRLLERERLAQVWREQVFEGRDFEVQAGTRVISGGMDPLPEGGYRLRLRLTHPEGSDADFEVTGEEMYALVASAYPRILEEMGRDVTRSFDRGQESARLLKQARWAGNAQLHREAIRLADAAWALHPEHKVVIENRLKMRDQMLAQRLNALSKELGRIQPVFSLGIPLDRGHAKSLDPLSFYDLDLVEDELLEMLETSFGLLERIAQTDPHRIVYQREMYEKVFLRLGHATSLFASIHRQKAHGSRLREVKQRGRAAVRALYDVEWGPGLNANPFAASPLVWRQVPYLFDSEELASIYVEHLAAMEEEAYFLSTVGRGLPGRKYVNVAEERSSNTPYPSRPLYPLSLWKYLPEVLSEESGWMAKLKPLTLKAASGPVARRIDVRSEVQRLSMENPTVPGFYYSWASAISSEFLPEVFVKELREIMEAQEEMLMYDLTDASGYVAIDRNLARELDRAFRVNPDFPGLVGSRKHAFDRFLFNHPDITADRKEVNEWTGLKPVMVFHPAKVSPDLEARYRWVAMDAPNTMVATESFLYMIMAAYPNTRPSKAPTILVYRMSRHDRTFEHFPLPEFLHRKPGSTTLGGFRTMSIAESDTHILVSNPHTGGIGLYHMADEKWKRLEGYTAGGRYGDVVVIDNQFVLLAERGEYRPADMNQKRFEQALIISVNPVTGEVEHLADNLRTPSRYRFETPGVWFGNLRVSQDGKHLGVTAVYYEPPDSGRREKSFDGGFLVDTGEWVKDQTMRTVSAYQKPHRIGDRTFSFHKPKNVSGEGRDFVFREGHNQGTSTRVRADDEPIQMLQASLFPNGSPVGNMSSRQPQSQVSFDNLLGVASGAYVQFYTHEDVLSAIEKGNRQENVNSNETKLTNIKAFPVSHASSGEVTGELKTLHLPSGRELLFRWVEQTGVWVSIHEISNDQFRLFRPDHQSGNFRGHTLNTPEQPAVYVSYLDALAYCEWLTRTLGLEESGLRARLPTGDEWTSFAQAGKDRKYPWGDKLSEVTGNYYDRSGILALGPLPSRLREGYRLPYSHDSGYGVSASVTAVPENEIGLHGLGGNVWEWTLERGEDGGPVVRGGSWYTYDSRKMKIDAKFEVLADSRTKTIGFRVVLGGE